MTLKKEKIDTFSYKLFFEWNIIKMRIFYFIVFNTLNTVYQKRTNDLNFQMKSLL